MYWLAPASMSCTEAEERGQWQRPAGDRDPERPNGMLEMGTAIACPLAEP
jgi:hypothetical protein